MKDRGLYCNGARRRQAGRPWAATAAVRWVLRCRRAGLWQLAGGLWAHPEETQVAAAGLVQLTRSLSGQMCCPSSLYIVCGARRLVRQCAHGPSYRWLCR